MKPGLFAGDLELLTIVYFKNGVGQSTSLHISPVDSNFALPNSAFSFFQLIFPQYSSGAK